MKPGKKERQEGRLDMNSLRLQLFQKGPSHPLKESCISQECASICTVTDREHPMGNVTSTGDESSRTMTEAICQLGSPLLGIWAIHLHGHHSEFYVRYTSCFNMAPVNVQYLKELWTCFQKGEVVNSLHNGLTQGFFFFPWAKYLKTKSLKIKLQLQGIPSSTLWNQYYKPQYSNILYVFEFCKLEMPSHKISISFTLCTKFNIT